MRDPLLALGCQDPVERISEAKERDSRRQSVGDLFSAWWACHQDKPVAIRNLAERVEVIAALAQHKAEALALLRPATADPNGLGRFLEATAVPWVETRKRQLANSALIREQAFGEALDPDKLERLGRYEVHLDRKLERMRATVAG